ncbi:MAG TPA: hypothetical protein VFC45_08200 [Pseudolabrys sp.]|nr:hypothetical protein [Pseudolabrys sp.]
MENTSKLSPVSDRDISYYQRRNQNRLFETLTSFFSEEAERRGISKKDICDAIRRDRASITRLLSTPSNVTADTISSFLLSLGAEMDYRIVRFSERAAANDMHPLIERVLKPRLESKQQPRPQKSFETVTPIGSSSPVVEAHPQ